MNDRIENITARDHIHIIVEKKGETRQKDIRPGIIEIKQNSMRSGFEATLSIQPPHSCKPSELAGLLYPEFVFTDFHVVRSTCYTLNQHTLQPL